MRAKVKLTYSVEVIVNADSICQIQDFANSTTPNEALRMCDSANEEWSESWEYLSNDASWDIDLTGVGNNAI